MLSYHTCPLAVLGGKDTGGMNVYVRELTRELGKLGIHVDVFTRSQDEHVPHVLHELGFGNRVVHIPAGLEVPMPKKDLVGHIPEFVKGILEFAESKQIKYDLIHSHYWMSGVAATQLSQVWGVPIIQMFHTLGEMKNRIAQAPSEIEGVYRLDGERMVMAAVNTIVASTFIEKHQLIDFYNADDKKIAIVPPGVDTEHFYPIPMDEARDVIGIPREDKMILYVGRIEPLKGIDTLIRSMACMKTAEITKHAYLVIIGGDPVADPDEMSTEMQRLQDLCMELSMDRTVVFLGKKNQDSLPYYYSAANVLVMPSHYESFGMVALEAMACGTPVIASQVGGLIQLVQHGVTGFHVPNGDSMALCDKLTLLLENDHLRAEMGEKASAVAHGYSWVKIAKKVSKLYHELLGVNEIHH